MHKIIENYQSLKSESSFPKGYINVFSIGMELMNHPKNWTKFRDDRYIAISILHGLIYGKENHFIKIDF